MQLSVVIVNYNVKYFLEQCLLSVQRAVSGIDAEVFVVDNASVDGSVEMVKEKFPWVQLIANKTNVGFSTANNQAIKLARGEYVLLLNPDTVVAEDTFAKCAAFMQAHPEAGALGVHMIDGKGTFLPESKRGVPTPAVAFYKTFGLAFLFPKSKIFGQYHLGFLPEKENHEVDILSGAFMFMRKSVLDKVGLLDETFFMYGEDVDLSFRIVKAGYKNYYLADTTIIHYKGESTKKGSLNYVRVFYNAMIIFARKHFSGNQSGLFSLLIHFAIVFRGLLTLVAGLLASSYLFIIDALLSFGGIYLIKNYWESTIKYSQHYYPYEFLFIVVPAYILVWIGAAYFSGGYDKPYSTSKIFRGVFIGTIVIAVLYAFIPNEWRFSRAIILLGAMWTSFEMIGTRIFYHLVRYQSFTAYNTEEHNSLVVGVQEAPRAHQVLRQLGNSREIQQTANIQEAAKAAAIYQSTELVFCSADYSFKSIIDAVARGGKAYDYKIMNPGADALIGSNSKDSAGDLYVAEKSYALFKPGNLRSKKLFNALLCLWLLATLPVQALLVKNFGQLVSNLLAVMSGKKWWVGFGQDSLLREFKHAQRGVLLPSLRLAEYALSAEELRELELQYARHYQVRHDLQLVLKNYSMLGA
ncbi:MAG: glycosyltransferase [Bacteroidetes bacterium]|nr:glycosyltransferase [Bacteroidota bacterium]